MKYGDIGDVTRHQGNIHDYLGMILKFDCEKKTVEIDMQNYVKDMLKEFPVKLSEKDIAAMPAADNLLLHPGLFERYRILCSVIQISVPSPEICKKSYRIWCSLQNLVS